VLDFAGTKSNFYYRLYERVKNEKAADEILDYLIKRINRCDMEHDVRLIEKFRKEHQQKICIFGAGQMGGELQRMLQGYNIEIEAFIDNSREKWGGREKRYHNPCTGLSGGER
jgi:hypothetical protein